MVVYFEFPGEIDSVAAKLKRSSRKIQFLRQELDSAKKSVAGVFTSKAMLAEARSKLSELSVYIKNENDAQKKKGDAAGSMPGVLDKAFVELTDIVRTLAKTEKGGKHSRKTTSGITNKSLDLGLKTLGGSYSNGGARRGTRTRQRRHSSTGITGDDTSALQLGVGGKFDDEDPEADNFKDWLSTAFGSGARTWAQHESGGSPSSSGSSKNHSASATPRGGGTPTAPSTRGLKSGASTLTAGTLEDLRKWGFDVRKFDAAALPELAMEMFEESDLVESSGLDSTQLIAFIHAVGGSYRAENKFHNFHHGIAVMHYCFLFLTTTKAGKLLDKRIQWPAMLIAAIGHDVDHPGLNNAFQISSESPLAVRYNDIAVLENHHAATTFAIMKKKGCDCVANLDVSERKLFRQLVCTAILQTDMVRHYQLMCDVRDAQEAGIFDMDLDDGGGAEPIAMEHVILLVSALVHAADLSNPVRPFEVARSWAVALSEEFKIQGEKESALGLPVSPLAKCAESEIKIAGGEIWFIGKVIIPFWEVMVEIIPALEVLTDQAKSNIEEWKRKKMVMEDDAAAAAAAAAAAPSPGEGSEEKAA